MNEDLKFAQLGNGIRLAYVEQGAQGGTPLVMLHGYSDSHRSYDLLRPLLPRTWRVIAVTMRGHGDSDKPENGYRVDELAADVPALLDALAIDRAVLVGHSLGAAVALQAAADCPERLLGVVLMGAFSDFRNNASVEELVAIVAAFEDSVDPAFVRGFQESTLANPVPEEFFELVVEESLKLPTHVWRSVATGMPLADLAGAAARCRVPAALLWGENDAYCKHADQLALRSALCAARLFTLKNTGHALHWERPVETASLLRAFVTELDEADALAAAVQ